MFTGLFDLTGQWFRNTRCMPGYKLLCMGAIVQKRRCHASATRKRAKRSFRFPPSKSKHHMSCWTPMYTHYCFTKSNIYHLVSSYCFVQLSPPARWEVLQDYYYIKGILYYVLVYTLLVYHGTHFASEPDGRRYHVGENLSVPMPSCPSYPCERLMLLLSHQKWHLKYEAAESNSDDKNSYIINNRDENHTSS